MTAEIKKRAIAPPREAPNRVSIEQLTVAVNELSGAVGSMAQRAVRVAELVDAGFLETQPDGQLGATGALDPRLRADLANAVGGKGAALLGYKNSDTQSVARTVAKKLGETASIADFGALVADDVTDNAATFNAALASSFNQFYLPAGTYYVGISSTTFTKRITGPGVVRFTDGIYTRGYSQIITRPDPGFGVGTNKYASASSTYTDMREIRNNSPRVGFSEAYNAPEHSMLYARYINNSGTSGNIARLAAALAVGATTATLNSVEGLTVGTAINFGSPAGGVATTPKTITAINTTTKVITFTPAVETIYHSVSGAAQALIVGDTVGVGSRTMTAINHYEFDHGGGGDAYVNKYRVYVGGAVRAGEDHVYMTKTGGIDGGDMIASADGVYMTGREVRYSADRPNSSSPFYDIAVVGEVHSLQRNNITGARGAFWVGSLFKSDGETSGGGLGYCDAAHVVQGYWRRGIDFTTATITATGGAQGRGPVINMGADQRIYWDSGFAPTPGALYSPPYSSFYGDTWTGYDTVAQAWDVTVDGSLTLRVNPTKTIIASASTELQGRLMATATALHNNALLMEGAANDFVGSGTYAPTITAGDNMAAASAVGTAFFTRVGRVVHVSGSLSADPTLASTDSTVAISLPIASDLAVDGDLSGTATGRGAAGLFGSVYADTALNRAVLYCNVADTLARTWTYEFSYLVK